MIKMKLKLALVVFLAIILLVYFLWSNSEKRQLNKIIERLSAESRVAEVLVTASGLDPSTKKNYTTIKFLEYDTNLKPLQPKYFTFSDNTIHFQAMVIRFDDFYVKKGDPLRGKSAYIFMKAFTLNKIKPEIFEINKLHEIPSGYEIKEVNNSFEKKIWKKFWEYALDPKEAKRLGIKNAQLEAPGTRFIKGMLYKIKIEHDGGLRIDAERLPRILQGENISFD